MDDLSTATGRVSEMKRVGLSYFGNPTYRVTFVDGRTWLTGIDSQVGYSITNYERQQRDVRLTLDEGRIIGAEWADE